VTNVTKNRNASRETVQGHRRDRSAASTSGSLIESRLNIGLALRGIRRFFAAYLTGESGSGFAVLREAAGGRVAILYGGKIFACRRCYGLAYENLARVLLRPCHNEADRSFSNKRHFDNFGSIDVPAAFLCKGTVPTEIVGQKNLDSRSQEG
jgi:hypothetical protein